MTAALSKALEVHDPNWLVERLAHRSYLRKVEGVAYAVIVSPADRLLAVYVVTPRRMRVRRALCWPSGVVGVADALCGPGFEPGGTRCVGPDVAPTISLVVDCVAHARQPTDALSEDRAAARPEHLRSNGSCGD